MSAIRNNEDLCAFLNQGGAVKYIYFWGHTRPRDGSVNQTCFSQWYQESFQVDGVEYSTAEHFMMAEKARLFDDEGALAKILSANHPGEAKNEGRGVRNFDEARWLENRFDIVVRGNLAKFEQNEALRIYLLGTGERVLVEASPVDRIWGIGMAKDDPDIESPSLWRGLNLLGYALMEVRSRLR